MADETSTIPKGPAKKPATKKPATKASKTPAAKSTAAPKERAFTVPVEYLIDFGEFKKGDTGKLEVSEARRLGWRGVVRETNNDPKK